MSPVISVLIADDQDLVREGLRMLLEAEPGITVVGEAGTGSEAIAAARKLDPDVVLMDARHGRDRGGCASDPGRQPRQDLDAHHVRP
jgi:DNA-binding NarL/FixJ family response regulator